MSRVISGSVSGPRSHESAQRVRNSTGASSLTLRIRNTRGAMPAISFAELAAVEPAAGLRGQQPVDDALAVALRLQAADEPGAGVRQALVVEVDRVLRREHHAEAEGARLLHERQHRQLRGRHRRRREVAEDLVHVEDRAQRRRAGLAAHPGDELVGDQRHDEHALRVGEVRDRDDGDARLALGREQQALDVERLALEPHAEAGRGEQVVHRHRELEPVLGGIEGLDVEHADLVERRLLDGADQAREVERVAAAPGGVDDRGQQDVLAALERIGGDADAARAGPRPPLRCDRASRPRRCPRAAARTSAGSRAAGPRCCPACRSRRPRTRGSGGCARRPGPTRRARSSRSRPSSRRARPPSCPCAPPRPGSIHGWNSAALRPGKVSSRLRDVALRVDHERRDAVERGLLEQRDAEARLAAAGHADADGVGREVPRVVHQRLGGERILGGVVAAAEVERAEFFEVRHGAIIRRDVPCYFAGP